MTTEARADRSTLSLVVASALATAGVMTALWGLPSGTDPAPTPLAASATSAATAVVPAVPTGALPPAVRAALEGGSGDAAVLDSAQLAAIAGPAVAAVLIQHGAVLTLPPDSPLPDGRGVVEQP